jgi:energy-coupling factor transporter transmembrane protein EcfT
VRTIAVRGQQINRISGKVIIVLSLIALLMVLIGYTQPPQPDEGTEAHIFQLSIVALVPMVLLFLATADWKQPWRGARPLAVTAAVLVVAFAALFYLEHYR